MHVPAHGVTANLIAHARRPLKVDLRARLERAQVGAAQRLRHGVEAQHGALLPRHREAGAVDGDGRADSDIGGPVRRQLNGKRGKVGGAVHAAHRRLALHDACGSQRQGAQGCSDGSQVGVVVGRLQRCDMSLAAAGGSER